MTKRNIKPTMRNAECCYFCEHFDLNPYEAFGFCEVQRKDVEEVLVCDEFEADEEKGMDNEE